MNHLYPTNLPGLVYYHDPTKLNYKKSSMVYQDKKKYGEIKQMKSYSLPNSFTQAGSSTINQNFESSKEYEPDYVKLDKKVLRFYGYFKESIVEEELESGFETVCGKLSDYFVLKKDNKAVKSYVMSKRYIRTIKKFYLKIFKLAEIL